MEEDLISKRELLELTGISYGQLYRWKRKNLIPEDWFVRKSVFTGQETFFPKEKILARIARIKDRKEDLSLDDLAGILSPDLVEVALSKEELMKRNIVSKTTLDFYNEQRGETKVLTFKQILPLFILDKLFQSGEINLEEGKILLGALDEHYPKIKGKNTELYFLRKLGVATCFLLAGPGEIYFENNIKVITRLNLTNCIEEIKMKLI